MYLSVDTEMLCEVMHPCCHLNTWTKAIIVEHMEIVQLPFSNKTNTKINKTKLNPTQVVYETQQEANVKAMNGAYS